MYIRRSKIPSCIYYKYQYRHGLEYEVRSAVYIPTYEYNYKVSQDVTQYYKNITSPNRRKYENTKRYTIIHCTNEGSEL